MGDVDGWPDLGPVARKADGHLAMQEGGGGGGGGGGGWAGS